MAAFDDKPTLERQRFFDGQLLLAQDLDDVIDDHRFRRELHNASCHKPGVARGFPVIGEPGDREVTIGEGYALDAMGHEIISTRTRVEPIPPVAGDAGGGPAHYDLTVSYVDDEELLEEAETRAGVCSERGVVRRREEPQFCWIRLERDAAGELHPVDPVLAADIEAAMRLRIARVEIEDCQLRSLSIAERRNARPPEQPILRCGLATPTWQFEVVPQIFLSSESFAASLPTMPRVFFHADIDTSAAGFAATPCYSASLRGPRRFPVELDGEPLEVFAEGVVSIEDPTPDGFHVRVAPLFLSELRLFSSVDLETLSIPWQVEWLGVER